MKLRRGSDTALLDDDPLWYKDAVIYEVHVRAFHDRNGDGIGDFSGLVEKLDYLVDLGITAIWLLPFYPSPLRDDGYDIADYTDVNAIYGSLADFKLLLREAHRRGLRVITELVLNHTSDQHAWFQRARRAAPGSSWRDFYVWSDSADKYAEARIIFKDFEQSNWAWDSVAKAYYWHRFYSHQPDLNFDNPAVHAAVFSVLDFWLGLGIDGLRLDAVPYLYEREGSNCENLPETHVFLKKLRQQVDAKYRNRMLLAEANQWPEDAVAYFGDDDECHMAFHFPLMPRLFMAIQMEDRFPIIDILQQTPAIPDTSQWALFLRNHDELTLEMVTDEDRDYMYRVYARDAHARINLGIRRRLAPLLENHRGKIELMNGLLLSLPGTPVIYSGDEIGMGDNIYLGDRNGVRTPMQWNPERNAGFSKANPQRLYLPAIIDPEYHYQTINVEAQQNNTHSLLWWMKRLIALRKRTQAFGRGTLEFLMPSNRSVLAYVRRYAPPGGPAEEAILVVANLSRFVQYVELDLARFKGMVPTEMLGRSALPAIGELPYLLTLGPYSFYWLALEPKPTGQPHLEGDERTLPLLEVLGSWQDVFSNRSRQDLERILPAYLSEQHWFVSGESTPRLARIADQIPVPCYGTLAFLALVQVEYAEGEPRTFVLPLAFAAAENAEQVHKAMPQAVICKLIVRGTEPGDEPQPGCLYDPLGENAFSTALLDSFARKRRLRGRVGELAALPTQAFPMLRGPVEPRPDPTLLPIGRGNTSVAFGDRLLLKVFRCVEEGPNPAVEIARALIEKTTFDHLAPLAGVLEYRSGPAQSMTLAALSGYMANEGDAWCYTLDALRQYFVHVLAGPARDRESLVPGRPFLELVAEGAPVAVNEHIGHYAESARLMGQRLAEFHVALASITDSAEFAPEPFTFLYQRSLYQTLRARILRVLELLREKLPGLPEQARADAQAILSRDAVLLQQVGSIRDRRLTAQRIRCHGDFRLASLLCTGKDFLITGLEGESSRPLSNRRHKRSSLRDLASLLHSLYLAVRTALNVREVRPEDVPVLEPWARYWILWISVICTKSYMERASSAAFLPRSVEETQILLDFYLLGRGIHELRKELLKAGDHIPSALQALLQIVKFSERRLSLHPSGDGGLARKGLTPVPPAEIQAGAGSP